MANATQLRIVAGLVLMGGAAFAARAQAVLTTDNNTFAFSDLWQADQDFGQVGNPHYMNAFGSPGMDFSGDASTTYNDMGLVGASAAHWERAYDPSNPGLGGFFSAISMSGSATADSASEGQWRDYSDGGGVSMLFFSVASDTKWRFAADIAGTTSASGSANSYCNYYFGLFSADGNTLFGGADKWAANGEGIDDSVDIGGVIPAGDYIVALNIAAGQWYEFAPGSGSASIELTNGVFMVPAPGAAALAGIGGLAMRRSRR